MRVIFADESAKEILDTTTVFPSDSPYIPSYMEIEMSEKDMSLTKFYTLFNDAEKTKVMVFERTIPTGEGESIMTETFYNYCRLMDYGKKIFYSKDVYTGEVIEEWRLYGRLEQV